MSKRSNGMVRIQKDGFGAFLWRFSSGAALDGIPRTDAGWLISGTEQLVKIPVSRWSYRPRLQRAAIRWAILFTIIATTYGYFFKPDTTAMVYKLAALVGLLYAGFSGYRRFRNYRHTQKYVMPMARTLSGLLGLQLTKSDKWLKVPVDFLDTDKRAEITIKISQSTTYPADLRKMVQQTVAEKAGKSASDFDVSWHMIGTEPYVSLRLAPRPPGNVSFADVEADMAAASEDKPLLGVAARSKRLTLSLDTDAPHAAFSCGTGAGKSVLGRLLIAQWLRLGVQVFILDAKQVSQSWCKDLPGVTYCRTGEEIDNAIQLVAADTRRRFELINSVPAEEEDSVDVGPRMVLFFEEQNIGMQLLSDYWETVKPKGAGKRSKAMKDLDYTLGAGRQGKAHVISIAQLFTVQAAGGNPAARENYGVRVLARATANAWKMLAPECSPFPKINKRRGRMFMVSEGEAVEFQVPFLSVKEARAWATGGDAPVTVPVTWTTDAISAPDRPGQTVTGQSVTGSVTADQGGPAQPAAPAAPALYTLAEAVRAEVVPMSYTQLRQAKSRDERDGDTFPKGVMVGKREKWTAAQLSEWVGDQLAKAITESDQNGGE